MPFCSRSLLWSLVVWTEIFAYTLLTQAESSPGICSIPVVALFVTLVAFVLFVQQAIFFRDIVKRSPTQWYVGKEEEMLWCYFLV